jgi:hypothetical protein
MFSTAYKAPLRHFHSISFQNYGADDSPRLECWRGAKWCQGRSKS